MIEIRENSDGIIIKVRVLPRSSKNTIAGIHGDAIKLKLTSPPVDGAANAACIEYFAKWLKISKSDVEIVSGHTSRSKQILCRGDKEKLKEMIRMIV
jgi:uncharacterized protein (TIGR00251 family)